jgi:glyoxylase-like metal-dependent hydrolase (beta-lactamase superfamily II)
VRSASDIPFVKGLHDLGSGTWAYLQPDGLLGYSNSGLVAGDQASLLVDTLFDLRMTGELLAAIATIVADQPLHVAVNTHANGDHTFGNVLLPGDTCIWASAATASEFDQHPPEAMAAAQRGDPLGRLNVFDFAGIELRWPDKTFSGSMEVDVGGRAVELIEVGPAHTAGDVVVHVPDAGVVFAGDVLFIGVAPMMWAGPVGNCIAAIDRICNLQPGLVVPGHGPVTDVAGVRRAQSLLEFVDQEARLRLQRGMSPLEALADIGVEPFSELLEPERMLSIADLVYAESDPGYVRMSGEELFANMAKLVASWGAT